jgi:hypothetical protein
MAFNSSEYAWADLNIVVAGRPITGFRGLKYKLSRTVTDIYASGVKPHARTKGNKTYTGELVLLQSEYNALEEAAQNLGFEDITDLTFNITAVYGKDPKARIKTDQLLHCDIDEIEKGMSQDDPNMELTLPLKIGDIKFNV